MLRLALISETDADRHRSELAFACERLRGLELIAVVHNWEQLKKSNIEQFDAVVIRSATAGWKESACEFARAGKHLLINGPLVQSAADLNQVATCCRSSNVRLMIGDTIRFLPSINAVKTAVDSGRLGSPALLRSHAWQPQKSQSCAIVDITLFQQLDLAQWVFRSLPTEIYAAAHGDHEDVLQIHLGFPNNAMGLITVCESLPAGDRYCSCTVIGTNGAAYADDQRQMQILYQSDGVHGNRTSEGMLSQVEELREFAAAISQNRSPCVAEADLQRVLLLMRAVRQSIQTRQPVSLKGDGDVSTH